MSDRNGSRPSVDERLCCNIQISQGDLQCFGTVFIALSEAKERAVRAMRQGRCKRCLSFSEAASSQWKFHICAAEANNVCHAHAKGKCSGTIFVCSREGISCHCKLWKSAPGRVNECIITTFSALAPVEPGLVPYARSG